MTSYYVRSGAAGAGTGADWANAYTTMTLAVATKAAGDIFYVSEDHAETSGSNVTITFPGTLASPNLVYCVNHSGTVPPVSADLRTTGSVATTANASLTMAGTFYVYGLIFSCGSGANGPQLRLLQGAGSVVYDTCTLKALGTIAQFLVPLISSNAQKCVLINTTMQFGSTGSSIAIQSTGAPFIWKKTASAIAGATIPTTLFGASTLGFDIFLQGVDLSALGSNTIFNASMSGGAVVMTDCKLGASAVIAVPGNQGAAYDVVRCDSGATNYRDERYWYQGTQTVDTTIVRTGGATDGTTVQSWKLVTTANSKWVYPFDAQPIAIWNDSISAITTLTIYGTTTGGGVPKDDEIWVEVEYLGSSLTPQGSFITTTKADNLAASAATNNSADGSTWAGGGAGNGFKIVVPTFTPGMKGPINITIKAAKASTTYYIDPVAYITGQAVSKSFIAAPGVYVNSAGGISRARAFAGFA